MCELLPVSDCVMTVTHPFCRTTTTVVVDDDGGCLLVDPGVTPDEIDAIAADIAGRGWRVTAGFSTHPHWDHLLWRESLGTAPRYATSVGARTALKRLDENIRKARGSLPGVDIGGLGNVTALQEGARSLPWGGPAVELISHQAHAPGHASLLIPGAGVLVAGDMLSDVEIPLPDRRSDDPFGDYAAALDAFSELLASGKVRMVVPGHGTIGDQAEMQRRITADRRYIDALLAGSSIDDPRLRTAEKWLLREHSANLALARDHRGKDLPC